MKNRFTILSLLSVIGLMAACKKENEPGFSPLGYWTGAAYILHSGILNQPSGKSNLYLQMSGYDSAGAVIKASGTYKLVSNKLTAEYVSGTDTFLLESNSLSSSSIKGIIILKNQGSAISFDFAKHP